MKQGKRPATGASEAGAVVRLAESADHFPLDEAAAIGALGAEAFLVVARAVVVAIFAEEAALRERRVANVAFEARNVEVLLLDAQHLARALLLARLTVRFTYFNTRFITRSTIKCTF